MPRDTRGNERIHNVQRAGEQVIDDESACGFMKEEEREHGREGKCDSDK